MIALRGTRGTSQGYGSRNWRRQGKSRRPQAFPPAAASSSRLCPRLGPLRRGVSRSDQDHGYQLGWRVFGQPASSAHESAHLTAHSSAVSIPDRTGARGLPSDIRARDSELSVWRSSSRGRRVHQAAGLKRKHLPWRQYRARERIFPVLWHSSSTTGCCGR